MRILITPLLLAVASMAFGQPLKDPLLRDEDISSVNVLTRVEKVGDEGYRYRYTYSLPESSIGRIQNVYFYLHCAGMDDRGKQSFDNSGFTRIADKSEDGRHVPLSMAFSGMTQFDASISANNSLRVMLAIAPGETRQIELLSPAKPGYIRTTLTANGDHELEYDYSVFGDHEPISPRAPWYPDWVVSGLVMGPACPGKEATPITRPIFSGQGMPDEMDGINELLRYEVKGNRNRWHAAATETQVKLRVYYDHKINPATFTATLNGRDIRPLFNPVAGAYQDVVLPLEGARTRIELAVYPREGTFEATGLAGDELHDIDPFEIRRPLPLAEL